MEGPQDRSTDSKPISQPTGGYKQPGKKVYHPIDDTPKKVSPKRKEKPKILKGVVLLIIAGILIMVLILPLEGYLPHLWGGPIYPEKARFTIQRTISLSVGDDQNINYNVTVPYPEDLPGNDMQKIHDIDWNVEPESFKNHTTGVEWKSWTGNLDSDSKEIVINYDVETSTVVWRYNRDQSGTPDQIDPQLLERYGGNQWQLDEDRNNDGERDWMIQPDHPTIRSLAEDVTRGEDTVYGKARSIYDWMQNNLEYERGSPGLPKHSIWTYESRSGDCDEWSYLYISMARAVGIPAWVELGVLYDRVQNEWGGHGWIRLQYVSEDEDSGWVNIDTVNRQFFARDSMRITTWVDDGAKGHLDDFYHYVSYNYTGDKPDFSLSEVYTNMEMETEGEVYIDDSFDLPWPGVTALIPAVLTATLVYSSKKFYDGNKHS